MEYLMKNFLESKFQAKKNFSQQNCVFEKNCLRNSLNFGDPLTFCSKNKYIFKHIFGSF